MTQQRTMSSLKSVFKNRRNGRKTRRIAFLEYTRRFYHLGNRAIGPDEKTCLYEPTLTSPGCAIGQNVPESYGLYGLVAPVTDGVVWFKLPGWMRDLGSDFLQITQQLHDREPYWTATGLSEIGEEYYNDISHFINDISHFIYRS